jgi:hypothetical protein
MFALAICLGLGTTLEGRKAGRKEERKEGRQGSLCICVCVCVCVPVCNIYIYIWVFVRVYINGEYLSRPPRKAATFGPYNFTLDELGHASSPFLGKVKAVETFPISAGGKCVCGSVWERERGGAEGKGGRE